MSEDTTPRTAARPNVTAPPGFPLQPGAAPGVTYTDPDGTPGDDEPTEETQAPVVEETQTPAPKRARRTKSTNADAIAEGPVSGTPVDADSAHPKTGKAAKSSK